jgi:hypothetical protein
MARKKKIETVPFVPPPTSPFPPNPPAHTLSDEGPIILDEDDDEPAPTPPPVPLAILKRYRDPLTKHLWAAAGSVLVMIAVQIGSSIYWAGQIAERVSQLEARVTRVESSLWHPMPIHSEFRATDPES